MTTPRTARKPAAKKAAASRGSHDDILTDAVRAVISSVRVGRRIGRTVSTAELALRLQLAAEEWARVSAA